MKKLVSAVAASAALASGIAMASPVQNNHQAFVTVFGGVDTTSTWRNIYNAMRSDLEQTNVNFSSSANNLTPWMLGVAAGYSLWQVSPTLNVGAEVGFNFTPSASNIKYQQKIPQDAFESEGSVSVRHTAINPMLFVSYTPIQKLTLTGKAGMGYQSYRYTVTGTTSNLGKTVTLGESFNEDAWKPVLAAEAAYNLSNRYALLVGDQYTFGDSADDFIKDSIDSDSTAHWSGVPSSNLVYVGAKVNF